MPACVVKKRACACAGQLTTSCAWSTVFSCLIKATHATGKKQSGNEASQPVRVDLSTRFVLAFVGSRLRNYLACTLPVCFSKSWASCHAVQATGCFFGKFVQLSSRSGCL